MSSAGELEGDPFRGSRPARPKDSGRYARGAVYRPRPRAAGEARLRSRIAHPETTITSPLALGIVAVLVVGKQLGITFCAWLAVKSGVSELLRGISWRQVDLL